jgi:hypothetical protein
MGLFRILFLVFRKHYRCNFTNSDSNTHAQSNTYTYTNCDSYAEPNTNSQRYAHADSRTRHCCCQSHHLCAAGKPQL